MERCVTDAVKSGISRFECYASLNAVDFYSRVGFKELRPIDVEMGDDRIMPSLLMERTL